MAKNSKPQVQHASGRWYGRRPFLNCEFPLANSSASCICPVCGHGTSDMQRDPLQECCACDCATQREADEQLRVSLWYDVELGCGGVSDQEPRPAKFSQRFEPRGVIMRDPDESLVRAMKVASDLPAQIVKHIGDEISSDWFSRMVANSALSNVDFESIATVAAIDAARRFQNYDDTTEPERYRQNKRERAVHYAMSARIEQLIIESSTAAKAEAERHARATMIISMRYGADGEIDMTNQEIADRLHCGETTVRRFIREFHESAA